MTFSIAVYDRSRICIRDKLVSGISLYSFGCSDYSITSWYGNFRVEKKTTMCSRTITTERAIVPLARHLLKYRREAKSEILLSVYFLSIRSLLQASSLWAAQFINPLSLHRKRANGFNRSHIFLFSLYRMFFIQYLLTSTLYTIISYFFLFSFANYYLQFKINFYIDI